MKEYSEEARVILQVAAEFGQNLSRRERAIDEIDNPRWDEADRRHDDWRNYIDDAIQGIWGSLPYEARCIAWLMADSRTEADANHWTRDLD